jgi:tRNA-specific 2-thiouridylase
MPAVAQVTVAGEDAERNEVVSELIVTPNEPLDGVSPGQTAVLYVGTRVLGQCTIARTVSAVPVEV